MKRYGYVYIDIDAVEKLDGGDDAMPFVELS